MLRLLFTRFWPVLIPIIVYLLWMAWRRRKATKAGHEIPTWLDGPWLWAVVSSALIGIGCFIILGLSQDRVDGTYIPAHMEKGRLIPGSIEK